MTDSDFKYSVAIRTLGKAGEKFRQELVSLHRQTISPQRILIYIAEGYPRPDFTIGREEYVYVKKGMVKQRALPYAEAPTDYLLLLDDDVFLPDDGVERLARAMIEKNADCVAPDVFHPQDSSFAQTVYNYLTNLVRPRLFNDGWAFKIRRDCSFSYPLRPEEEACRSQSAAGPASLWRKDALLNIRLADGWTGWASPTVTNCFSSTSLSVTVAVCSYIMGLASGILTLRPHVGTTAPRATD